MALLRGLSVQEIKTLFKVADINELPKLIKQAEGDERRSVRRLASSYRLRLERRRSARDLAAAMTINERELWADGCRYIAGVDEVGRGCLAGPMAAAAVILPPETLIPGLKDSKQLTSLRRKKLAAEIKEQAICWATALVSPAEIDAVGLHRANLGVLQSALEDLSVKPDFVLVDGFSLPGGKWRQRRLIKGDQRSLSIAAASVVAKVFRDDLMIKLSAIYPAYGFDRHKGYGTRRHLQALAKHGCCDLHRRSFKPVSELRLF